MAGIFGTPAKTFRLSHPLDQRNDLQEAAGPAVRYDHGHRLWMPTSDMDKMNRHIINGDGLMRQCGKALPQRIEVKLSGPILRQALGIIRASAKRPVITRIVGRPARCPKPSPQNVNLLVGT